jgi:hypothetical protein
MNRSKIKIAFLMQSHMRLNDENPPESVAVTGMKIRFCYM